MDSLYLETLWNKMHTRLCVFICSRLADESDAEDILQDIFIRIHTHLDTLRETDKVEGWIFQIARNSIVDYYRSQRPFVELNEQFAADEPSEETGREELEIFVRELVAALPEPYREALILTEYEGLSQVELAEHMGISLSGAKSRVQRARQQVKEAMLSCCHYEFDARGTIYDYHEHCCCCCDEPVCI